MQVAPDQKAKPNRSGATPKETVAAISVGLVDGAALLDLDYSEDVAAAVDMNVVMTGDNRFVEVQGTGEEATFARRDLDRLLRLASWMTELAEVRFSLLMLSCSEVKFRRLW